MSRAFVPLVIFILMIAVLLLASEALNGEQWNTATPTVWRVTRSSTSTPVPQVERTQWWAEITPPTPKPTTTVTVMETQTTK